MAILHQRYAMSMTERDPGGRLQNIKQEKKVKVRKMLVRICGTIVCCRSSWKNSLADTGAVLNS